MPVLVGFIIGVITMVLTGWALGRVVIVVQGDK